MRYSEFIPKWQFLSQFLYNFFYGSNYIDTQFFRKNNTLFVAHTSCEQIYNTQLNFQLKLQKRYPQIPCEYKKSEASYQNFNN